MKTIKSLQIGFLAAMLFVSSCKQDVLTPDTTTPTSVAEVETTPEDISSEDAKRARVDATAAVAYTVSPAQNTFTACSSGAQSPTCATFQAGLRAFVKNVDGNKITVQIQRCDGKPFGSGGTGYIKPTNLCGGPNSLIAGNSSWTRTDFYFIDVDFWATFNSGTVAFYPTITLNNGTRMYSNPISVIAKVAISSNFPTTGMKDSNNNPSYIDFARAKNAFKTSLVGQCTWYTYGRIQELAANGYISANDANTVSNTFTSKYTSSRDAKNWTWMLSGNWISTSSSKPLDISLRQKGMIIVWNYGPTGHVGFVEEVSADKKTYRVSEFNVTALKYSEKILSFDSPRTISLSYPNIYPSFYPLNILK